MKLSETLVPRNLYDRIDELFFLTTDQKKLLKESLFEGIKGRYDDIWEFLDSNKTTDPVSSMSYYPLSIKFIIGFDTIEIMYSDRLLTFVNTDRTKFIYDDAGTNITFPLPIDHEQVIEETLNFTTIIELNEFRNMTQLKFGDCKISEHKV